MAEKGQHKLSNFKGRNSSNKPASKGHLGAKKKWQSVMGKVLSEKSFHDDGILQHEGLIEEIKKANHGSKAKGGILSILKTQADLTKKVFERQKYSAKKNLNRNKRNIKNLGEGRQRSYIEYEHQARNLYTITPEIQLKLDKIKVANEAEANNRHEENSAKLGGFSFKRMVYASVLGQTLMANPRFYTINPHDHLPDLCRRCRRPLLETLESRFTSIGILFCLFLPIIGILLLFANREFVCVICEELYVYGDLTAEPEEDEEED